MRLEPKTPARHEFVDGDYDIVYYDNVCPHCGRAFFSRERDCSGCGQAIDWDGVPDTYPQEIIKNDIPENS